MSGQQQQQLLPRSANMNYSQPNQSNPYSTTAMRSENSSQYQNLNQASYQQNKLKMDNASGGGCWDDLASGQTINNPQKLQQQQQQLQFSAQKQYQQSYANNGRGGGGGGYGSRQNGYNFVPPQMQQRRGYQTSGTNFKDGIKVYITGLAPTIDWRMLKDFLRQAGSVTFASNWKDGTGVGEFATMQDATASIRMLSGTSLHGSAIRISMERGSVAGSSMTGHSGPQKYSNNRVGEIGVRQGGRGGGNFSVPPNSYNGPRQPQNNMQFASQGSGAGGGGGGGGGGYPARSIGQQYSNNDLNNRRRQARYNPY